MTIQTGFITWLDNPKFAGATATLPCDFSVSNIYNVNLKGSYHDQVIFPEVVTVDNTASNQNSFMTLNGITSNISAFTRQNFPIIDGTQNLTMTGNSPSVTTLSFYADKNDAPADNPNYANLIQQVVSASLPAGVIVQFAGQTANVPNGWLLCDGTPVSRTLYPALFATIGVLYGAGDGSTTFNLPDGRDRVFIGSSPGGLTNNRPTVQPVAGTGGEESHTLLTSELAQHTHTVTDPGHTHTTNGGTINSGGGTVVAGSVIGIGAVTANNNTSNITINNAGANTPHNNMQPFIVGNWIIRTGN